MAKVNLVQFSGGMQRRTSRLIQADYEADLLINLHGDKIGARTSRLGYTQVGNTLETGKPVLGLFGFYQKNGTDYLLATIDNSASTQSVLAYNNAGTWTDITGATTLPAGAASEFATFIDYCFIVGGRTMTTGSLTGTTYSTATNVTSAPLAKYVKVYKDRLYLLNCSVGGTAFPSRIYRSSIPSGAPLAITWDTTNQFESINEDDGEELTGGEVFGENLILFKETTMHAYNNVQPRTWQVDSVGCAAHRTIQVIGGVMFFLAKTSSGYSIRAYAGGSTRPISGKIDTIVNSITDVAAAAAFSAQDHDHYFLYLGDLAIDGVTYTNCEVVYKISTNEVWVNSFLDDFTVYAPFRNSGIRRIHAGAADGEVHQRAKEGDTTYTDDGSSIEYLMYSKKYDFGQPFNKKKISRVYTVTDEPKNALFQVRLDDGKWQGKKLNSTNEDFELNPSAGYTAQFALSGNTSSAPTSLLGVGFEVTLEDNTK